jgi:TonB family protein
MVARKVAPYLIALVTAALVLITFYGVGGYLAQRNVPSNAGKLMLPPMPPIPEEVPSDPATPDPAKAPKVKQAAARKIRASPPPIPSIIVTRGAKPIRQTSLAYPAEAQKENVSGVVEMQLTIAEDGSVQSPRVLSGDPLLRAGLTEEVSKWVYQPMRVNGKAVAMTTELAIRFDLN